MDTDGLVAGAMLVTLDGDDGYGVVEDGTLAWRDGVIRFAGPRAELPAELAGDAIDVGGDCITPGLVDCHTHAVFAGDRAGEFEQRLQGSTEEHKSELQTLKRISDAGLCFNKKT